MKGQYKSFDGGLFDENDPKSRKVIIEIFKKLNIPLKDDSDKYAIDLIAADGSFSVELEHRPWWKGAEFPFEEVNIPERKARLFNYDKKFYYVILSKDFTRLGMIPGSELKNYIVDDQLKENPNKYVSRGELFYKVPRTAFRWKKV